MKCQHSDGISRICYYNIGIITANFLQNNLNHSKYNKYLIVQGVKPLVLYPVDQSFVLIIDKGNYYLL